jgi:predicted RNA-binding protein YlqC (UPF0109 family)
MVKKVLEQVVKRLVEQPDSVMIQEHRTADECSLKIFVAADDIKRVIGKEGRVIKSLRSLVKVIGADNAQHYLVDVVQ